MRWRPTAAALAQRSRFHRLVRPLFGDIPGPVTGPMLAESDDDQTEHLEEVPDGAGCAEIWEHLSEHGESTDDSASTND